jgi:hypothetical protein
MSSDAYREILGRIEELSLEEQLDLIADILKIVRRHTVKPQHSVREFRGIAKDFWKDVDVEKYIQEERTSWEREFWHRE